MIPPICDISTFWHLQTHSVLLPLLPYSTFSLFARTLQANITNTASHGLGRNTLVMAFCYIKQTPSGQQLKNLYIYLVTGTPLRISASQHLRISASSHFLCYVLIMGFLLVQFVVLGWAHENWFSNSWPAFFQIWLTLLHYITSHQALRQLTRAHTYTHTHWYVYKQLV